MDMGRAIAVGPPYDKKNALSNLTASTSPAIVTATRKRRPGVASDGSKGGTLKRLDAVTPGLTLGTLYSSRVGINKTKQHSDCHATAGRPFRATELRKPFSGLRTVRAS